MVCLLPAPLWDSDPPSKIGVISATENVVDGYINLTFADAIPTGFAQEVYYLIYYDLDVNDLYDAPKLIATTTSVSIPNTMVTLNHYIAARVAQLGVANTIDTANLIPVNANLFLYPSAAVLLEPIQTNDAVIAVDSTEGYPSDGYLLSDDEIIYYDTLIDGYGFAGLHRDPYNCDNITYHPDGYEISLFAGFQDKNTNRQKALASCGMPKPVWLDVANPGIKSVEDLGIGGAIRVNWTHAKGPAGFPKVHYNIYQAASLVNMLGRQPLGFSISPNLTATITDLEPGKGKYYLVHAAYHASTVGTSGFQQISTDFYGYPDPVTINEPDGYLYTNETGNLFVSTTDGFPTSGYLQIESEVLRYSGITSTSFNINARDTFTVGATKDYANGTKVWFFRGIEDSNRYYYRTTPSWDHTDDVPRLPGGPDYNQDADGYRSLTDDNVTEDHSGTENQDQFDPFHYCGYRAQDFRKLYSRQQCGTYSGGRQDGFAGGIDANTVSNQRLEILLGLTGERFILLRKKWTGKQCPRLSMRSNHPHERCGLCYGTEFLYGYDRIYNTREIDAGQPNINGFILMRVTPYVNDLELSPDRGLAQVDQLEVWTIPVPIIKDRDILIRYTKDPVTNIYTEEYRYEILNVTRNKLLFGADGVQKASIKKLDKTREVYKFPVSLV